MLVMSLVINKPLYAARNLHCAVFIHYSSQCPPNPFLHYIRWKHLIILHYHWNDLSNSRYRIFKKSLQKYYYSDFNRLPQWISRTSDWNTPTAPPRVYKVELRRLFPINFNQIINIQNQIRGVFAKPSTVLHSNYKQFRKVMVMPFSLS